MEYLSYKFMPPKASKPTNKLVLRPNRTEYSPQPDETDSLYSEKDTSSILNVTTTPDPSCTGRTEKSFGASSTPNKTTSKSTDKCPCGKSDPQSTKVICAKCKRHWHNRCCNLSGLTQPMIKKLETWQCPKCYSCPILSQQPASLHAEFSAMKQQINLLLESNSQKECCQSISAEVTALREQLSELVKVSKENEVKVKLSPDLEEAVRQVAQLSPELIAKIEESVTELKGQVSGIETAISNHSKAPSEKAVAPNTQSPNISTKVISPCTPYVNYQPNVISDDDRDEVLKFIKANEEHFQSLGKDSGSRDVMYFGEYTYRYTGHTHDAREMPETLTKILNAAKTAVPEGSNQKLTAIFNNIDGNASNFDMFVADITRYHHAFSIIGIAETNVDIECKDLYRIPGYVSEYNRKKAGKLKGSGVALYLQEDMIFSQRDDLCQCTDNLESLFVTITNLEKPQTVGVLYRPPGGNNNEAIKEFDCLMLKCPDKDVVLLGDFNFNLFDPQSSSEFEDSFFCNNMIPVISVATHEKPGCAPTLIDNIMTNSTDNLIGAGVLESRVSHHFPIFCILNCSSLNEEPQSNKFKVVSQDMPLSDGPFLTKGSHGTLSIYRMILSFAGVV
ncbi:hypothetical protein ACHWQZ_G010197 [Mnemiopsis leidyi]